MEGSYSLIEQCTDRMVAEMVAMSARGAAIPSPATEEKNSVQVITVGSKIYELLEFKSFVDT